MNNRAVRNLRGGIFGLALLTAGGSLGPHALAQVPQGGPPSGAPHHQWQGKPGATPPNGTPQEAVQGQPVVGAPPGAVRPISSSIANPGKKTAAGEQFFIVASIDLQKSQLLLKYPTEVTVLVRVDDKTKLTDATGAPLKLSDFRAGDTVWVASADAKGEVTALRVRKGLMDVADLHRYYLDYAEVK